MYYKIDRWIDLIIHPYKCLVIQDLILQGCLHGNRVTQTPLPHKYTLHASPFTVNCNATGPSRIQIPLAFLAF